MLVPDELISPVPPIPPFFPPHQLACFPVKVKIVVN